MEKFVSYETPVGCFATWEKAADAVSRSDMDPCEVIKAVVSPTDVSVEWAYGSSFRLSQPIRVF